MKKFLLFLLSSTLLLASPYPKASDNANKQVVEKILVEQSMAEQDYVPAPIRLDITTNDIEMVNNISIPDQCKSYADLPCPTVKDTFHYFVRKYKADLKTGEVSCLVYSKDNLDRAVAQYTYTNSYCASSFEPNIDNALASPALNTAAAKAREESAILKEAQTSAKTRAEGLSEQQLNLSDILISVMTLDGSRLDLVQSLAQGRIKTANGYTSIVENQPTSTQALSDLAQSALNTKVVAIFELMSKSTDILNLTMFMLVMIFGGGYLLKSGVAIRAFDENEREGKRSEAILWVAGVVGTFLFFLVPNVNLSINAEQRFEQSRLQGAVQSFFAEAGVMANKLNLIVHDAAFNAALKERGFKTSEEIYRVAAEQEKLELLTAEAKKEFVRCTEIFDVTKVRIGTNITSRFSFPLSEKELHEKLIVNFGGHLSTSPYFADLKDLNTVSTQGLTMSYCGQMERKYHENRLKIMQNHEFLTGGNSKVDRVHRQRIIDTMTKQYKAVNDWGFISAAFLPYSLGVIDVLNYLTLYFGDDKLTTQNEKDVIDTIFYNLPYLLVPGASTIKESLTFNGSGIVGSIASAITGGMGAVVAIQAIKLILVILPYLLMTVVGLIYGLILFFKIIAYFISAIFAFLLALWHNNGENIFGFLGRGLRLFAEIVAFPLSMFFGLEAHWVTTSAGGYLANTFAGLNTQGFWSSMAFQLLGGFLNISLVLVSIFLSYKIITKFVDIILENLNFAEKSSMNEIVQEMSQAAKNQMPKTLK